MLQEVTIEEIRPSKTFSPAGRSLVTAYNVVTHTSTITHTSALYPGQPALNTNNNILQRLNLFQGLLPNLRYPPDPLPPLPTTTFTTTTVTEISTVTSDVTTQLTVTLFGRSVEGSPTLLSQI